MNTKRKWVVLFLLVPFLCVTGAGVARAELQPLGPADFPCETLPPQCPESVGFLVQLKGLFPNELIELNLDERIDIDSGGVCDELYIEAGAEFSLPIEGMGAELFMIRDPADPWNEDVATNLQLQYVNAAAGGTLNGRDCIGFVDFTIPLNAQIFVENIVWQARYGVWLDTDTNKVQLSDDFSDVGFTNFYFHVDTGMGQWWDDVLNTLLNPVAASLLHDLADNLLIGENGAVFGLVEGIMDGLYHIQPCGCMLVPTSRYPGGDLRGHIFVNMLSFLLPVGVVVFWRRRMRK